MSTSTHLDLEIASAVCPGCGIGWGDHVRKGESIHCPNGGMLDISPMTRELPARPFRRTDFVFGTVCVVIGAATIAVGITRWYANVPLASYGVGLIACGALLIRSALR